MNRLATERAAYLKHSAYQKIDWYPWSDEPFVKAKAEDKPIFLSSGAVWCHWCHVMAKECFEDEEIVRILNENFINIKIDRDERPDIDKRYQQAVAVMGAGGGWPLSVFLTPDKKPFFGGTYFPPEDRSGMPGFKKVLLTVADFYRSKKDTISDYSSRLIDHLKTKPVLKGETDESLYKEAVKDILSEFDPQNGGFGDSPKFPMPGAMEFLINRYSLTGEEALGYAVKKSLESMAKGGFYDQIGGGFHRYSTDAAWIVPHFEKMADDNAWLLRNYITAYSVFGDEFLKKTAEGTIRFIKEVLSHPDGGFYASQDADVTPDDEGGYFTWTDKELRKALNDEEIEILFLHLFHERGSMHHNASKKVLFVSMEAEEIARTTGKNIERVIELINAGKEKLLEERKKRETPFIDRTFYTSLNGMLVTSYLTAFRVLKEKWLKDFALKSLERIMERYFISGELYHTDGVKAFLDDYIFLTESLISAYEVTGNQSHVNWAERLMELCINKLWDENEGGFFDSADEILGLRLKGAEDIPHPSSNSVGIILLLKLYSITGKETYHERAKASLKTFSSKSKDIGIHAGYYFSALDASFNMLRLTLHVRPESELSSEALSSLCPHTVISHGEDNGFVLPCFKTECFEPVFSPEILSVFLKKWRS